MGSVELEEAGEERRSQSILGFVVLRESPLYHKSSEKSLMGFDQQYDMIGFAF